MFMFHGDMTSSLYKKKTPRKYSKPQVHRVMTYAPPLIIKINIINWEKQLDNKTAKIYEKL